MEAPACIDPPEYPSQPDLAVSALLSLMTGFTARPSFAKAGCILGHLQLVAADARHSDALRDTAARLAEEWRALAATPPGAGAGCIH